ncbi:MAG: hypothetical protein M0R38_10840 [Bacteroidia bacterium]|nr:hypothetical protein [Bacteroidia bacterium]
MRRIMELKEKLINDLQEMQNFRNKLDNDEQILLQNKASLDFNISYIKSLLAFMDSDNLTQPTLHDIIEDKPKERKKKEAK